MTVWLGFGRPCVFICNHFVYMSKHLAFSCLGRFIMESQLHVSMDCKLGDRLSFIVGVIENRANEVELNHSFHRSDFTSRWMRILPKWYSNCYSITISGKIWKKRFNLAWISASFSKFLQEFGSFFMKTFYICWSFNVWYSETSWSSFRPYNTKICSSFEEALCKALKRNDKIFWF